MVNNCPFCTVSAFGLLAVLIAILCYYGIGALCMTMAALICLFAIMMHKVCKAQQQRDEAKANNNFLQMTYEGCVRRNI